MTSKKRPRMPSEKVIEDALTSDLDIEHLKVSIVSGVPYVEGSVSGFRDKRRATEIVGLVWGRARLVNRLRVMPHVMRNDEAIAKVVFNRLQALSELGLAQVSIHCHNGVVEMTGEVGSWAARRAAERVAHSVRGVVSVVNRLRVKGADRPAKELENEIKRALNEFLSLEAATIDVKFKRGTVQLLGTVPSPYHRLAAEDLVRWFSPVREVVNGLATRQTLLFSQDVDTIQEREASAPSA